MSGYYSISLHCEQCGPAVKKVVDMSHVPTAVMLTRTHKDQDKEYVLVLKESLRTRTRTGTNITAHELKTS